MSHNPIELLDPIREQVLRDTVMLENLITKSVTYRSGGHLVLIGPEDRVRTAAAALKTIPSRTLLFSEQVAYQNEADLEQLEAHFEQTQHLPHYSSHQVTLDGYLGQFKVHIPAIADESMTLSQVAIKQPSFDLVLDMGRQPLLNVEMLPPGYYYVGEDQALLAAAMAELPNLTGEFDKPSYAKINQTLCAHNRSGISGCTRCLSVCSGDAISIVAGQVEIDQFKCHGVGSCSTVCPTGAIHYDKPTNAVLGDYLKRLIQGYQQQASQPVTILFHDSRSDVSERPALANLPQGVLPVALEDIAVAGLDLWFACLAFGASQVQVLLREQTEPTLLAVLEQQQTLASTLLNGIGMSSQLIALISESELLQLDALCPADANTAPVADFKADQPKRELLYAALDHLNQAYQQSTAIIGLKNAPYGTVKVDTERCTLCQSCSALCPTRALNDGGEEPLLSFTEQSCIQCGICERACPERAITLVSQVTLDATVRQQHRILFEEEAFCCITCNKPFATKSMVAKMTQMLSQHASFAGEAQNRLQMCEDCRVKDLFTEILDDPEKQLRV